jgi:hypothetical protein
MCVEGIGFLELFWRHDIIFFSIYLIITEIKENTKLASYTEVN